MARSREKRLRRLRRAPLVASIAALAVVVAAGCATATNSLHPGRETIKVAHLSKLGPVLADENGKTLYLFDSDPRNASSCDDACLSLWPPVLTQGKPQAEGAVSPGELSTFKRADGDTQVAYDGHPLYYYQADSGAGDAYGQGLNQFGADWYAVSPGGHSVEHAGGGS
jgi:predicted lipoprotein with Yx(FWY)xxD motif